MVSGYGYVNLESVCVLEGRECIFIGLCSLLVSREFTETNISAVIHKHNLNVCEEYTDTLSFLCS